jgi:two-component system sensor histidine kinase CpxA
MQSLFLRIFLLFWVSMALIIAASIAVTYVSAAREYEQQEFQRRPPTAIAASEAYAGGGVPGLRAWLKANRNSIPDRDIYVVAPDGRDILGLPLSEAAVRRLEFISRDAFAGADPRPLGGPPPQNFRPARHAPQIITPDGTAFTILLVPRRPTLFGPLALPGVPLAILGIALSISALASWWLARHFSAPIRRMQAGARALAGENLDVRVSAGLDGRRDELAVLARDFDAMADQLKATRSARTQLLRDISHELRSPLARMRVAVGLARQPDADPTRQLDRMEREIERLDALISQVLKLARLQGADADFRRETLDVREIALDVVRDANFEGAAKDCAIRLQGEATAKVRANPELLRSAIENVLRNAVRYSPAGVPVDVGVGETGHGQVEILVEDRGPGVPPADLERIFEPFYRVAASRDRDSGGEGIGLAITSQVMRSHGGSAAAANRPGGGLAVRLLLPVEAAVAPAAHTA